MRVRLLLVSALLAIAASVALIAQTRIVGGGSFKGGATITGEAESLNSETVLHLANFTYLGAFNTEQSSYMNGVVTLNGLEYYAANNSLIGSAQWVNPPNNDGNAWEGQYPGILLVEFPIPNSLGSGTNNTLWPYQSFTQGPIDVFGEGTATSVCALMTGSNTCNNQALSETNLSIGGLLWQDNCLYINIFGRYDATPNNAPGLFKYCNSGGITFATGHITGPFTSTSFRSGDLEGYIASIPTEWRSSFGNHDAYMGGCCHSISTRTTEFPPAFAFTTSGIGSTFASPGMFYQEGAGVPYPDDTPLGDSPYGSRWIPGTRTLVFGFSSGTGTRFYGGGTATNPPDPYVVVSGGGTPIGLSGNDASTDNSDGCLVTIPNGNAVPVQDGEWVLRLDSQTTPQYIDHTAHPTWYPGVSYISSHSGSGATFKIRTAQCFPTGLSTQAYHLGPPLAYDPDHLGCCGYHQYPYNPTLTLQDAATAAANYGTAAVQAPTSSPKNHGEQANTWYEQIDTISDLGLPFGQIGSLAYKSLTSRSGLLFIASFYPNNDGSKAIAVVQVSW